MISTTAQGFYFFSVFWKGSQVLGNFDPSSYSAKSESSELVRYGENLKQRMCPSMKIFWVQDESSLDFFISNIFQKTAIVNIPSSLIPKGLCEKIAQISQAPRKEIEGLSMLEDSEKKFFIAHQLGHVKNCDGIKGRLLDLAVGFAVYYFCPSSVLIASIAGFSSGHFASCLYSYYTEWKADACALQYIDENVKRAGLSALKRHVDIGSHYVGEGGFFSAMHRTRIKQIESSLAKDRLAQ